MDNDWMNLWADALARNDVALDSHNGTLVVTARAKALVGLSHTGEPVYA